MSVALEAGLNTIFWDQRENPPPPPEPREGQQQFRFRGPRVGPQVPPGQYMVRLTVGSRTQTTVLIIEKDEPGYMGR
jgi:hypothetical protein